MHCAVLGLLTFILLALGSDAHAGKRKKPRVLEAAPPPVVVPAATALVHFVREELARAKRAKQPGAAVAWLDSLALHFSSPEARPLWVDLEGYTWSARYVIGELRSAGDWGLDPDAFAVPQLLPGQTTALELAKAEIELSIAVAKYCWHARGGRVIPAELSLWLDQRPRPVDAVKIAVALSASFDPAEDLRSRHPKHPQFEILRQSYLAETRTRAEARSSIIPDGAIIEPGGRHPHVAIVRRRLGVQAGSDPELFDTELQLALETSLAKLGHRRKAVIDDKVRALLNRQVRSGLSPLEEKLRVNMERWRWLPHDLGAFHIWNNLPEFETRVVRNGEVIHRERIVIGTTETQTPVFTGWMTHIIFHPEWRLPESIKISSLMARLRGGDTSVLRKRNLKIHDGEKEIAPKSIKWDTVDIREVPIVQGSGSGNPLGSLKFMFPNKHDVYMHDTPAKHLFDNGVRAYSHGCIRVKNPVRLAEVLLGEIKGWSPADVRWQMRQKTARLDLERAIPVHNTYFTLLADETGALREVRDIYGHDRRIAEALAGRTAKSIASRDPALALKRKNEELVKAADEAAHLAEAQRKLLTGEAVSVTGAKSKPASGFQLFWFGEPESKPPPPVRATRKKPAGGQKHVLSKPRQ